MKKSLVLLAALALSCGCAPTAGNLVAASTSAPSAYQVDPRILGKYGMQGDVAWFLNPGHRPMIWMLERAVVDFEPGTSDADVQAFLKRYGATVIEREVLPAPPGSQQPAKPMDTYLMVLGPASGDIMDLATAALSMGITELPVFSSERAARLCYTLFQAKRDAAANHLRNITFDSQACIPEDCGVTPDDPYASPAPTASPASGGSSAGWGYVEPSPPPGSQRLDVTDFPAEKGTAYVSGNALFLEAPGQPARRLVAWEDRTSLLYLDPELRYVLLQERPEPTQEELAKPLVPGQPKPNGGSRLVERAIGTGERRVLIPHVDGYDIQLAVAPDGHTVAVRTTLDPALAATGESRRMYLLDLDHPEALRPWLGSLLTFQFRWAPAGLALAIVGAPTITSPQAVYVATPESDTARELLKPDAGLTFFTWLSDGSRLVTGWSGAKYGGGTHVSVLDPAGGSGKAFDLDLGDAHVDGGQISPDGRRVLLLAFGKDGSTRAFALELATGELKRYAMPDGIKPSWAADGTLQCGSQACLPQ